MGCYVIAVGGTGNKVLESLVYGGAADIFYTEGEGCRQPIDRIHMLVVDVDASCGNTTRAQQAAEHYRRTRALYEKYEGVHRGFHTELTLRHWNMDLSKRATSIDEMVKNHKKDQLLAQTLFDKTESSLEYSEGFRGHPDLGVLFFSDLLQSLDENARNGNQDEMWRLLDQVQRDLGLGVKTKIILVGSIFGGTGAAGIPTISRFIRERFRDQYDLLEMGVVILLPYYNVPPAVADEELEIVVKSSVFLDKARTALHYYGKKEIMRSSPREEQGVYDAVYLLGLPQEDFVDTKSYSTGSQSQENDAHLLEWLAARCVASFFRTSFREVANNNIDCYYYQIHSKYFDWDCFDREREIYRGGYAGLLKAAAVFFAECYPYIRGSLLAPWGRGGRRVNYYAAYFSRLRRVDTARREGLIEGLESMASFFRFYCRWMVQLLRSMPPNLRKTKEKEEQNALLEDTYQQLVDLLAWMQAEGYEAPVAEVPAPDRGLPARGKKERVLSAEEKRQAALEAEVGELRQTQARLEAQVEPRTRLEILRRSLQNCEASLAHQEAMIAENRKALDELEKAPNPDPLALAQERRRLSNREQNLRQMSLKRDRVLTDQEALVQTLLMSAGREEAEGEEEPIPENELFDARLVGALEDLISLLGTGSARDEERALAISQTLQRDIQSLCRQRAPDTVTMPRIIAGLGGFPGSRGNSEGTELASFLTGLLHSVFEEAVF